MEKQNFKFATLIASILGQYPFSKLGTLFAPKFRISSPIVTWSILLFTYNVISAQTVLSSINVAQNAITGPNLYPNVQVNYFGAKLALVLSAVVAIQTYIIYLCWFFTIPKLVTFIRRLGAFNLKFPHKKGSDKEPPHYKFLFHSIFRWIFWFNTAAASAFSISFYVYSVEAKFGPELSNQLWASSWLLWLMPNATIVEVLVCVHTFICQMTLSLQIEFIYNTSYQLGAEINCLTQRITDLKSQVQQGKEGCESSLDLMHQEILELHQLFICLENFVGLPLLILITLLFITTTLMVFTLASTFISKIFSNDVFPITLYVWVCFIGYMLTILGNVGENLVRQANEMKMEALRLIINSTPKGYPQLNGIQKLLLGKEVNFQLTACKYFKLNRSMLVSFVSALVSYNVIIIQFQLSFGGGWESKQMNNISLL